jgi:hypothetical protein
VADLDLREFIAAMADRPATLVALAEWLDGPQRADLRAALDDRQPPPPPDYASPIVLSRPIRVNGQDVHELPIRNQPNVGHVETMERMTASGATGVEMMREVMAHVCAVPKPVLSTVHVADMPVLMERFLAFFAPLVGSVASIPAAGGR